jgi:hypothetical protein
MHKCNCGECSKIDTTRPMRLFKKFVESIEGMWEETFTPESIAFLKANETFMATQVDPATYEIVNVGTVLNGFEIENA